MKIGIWGTSQITEFHIGAIKQISSLSIQGIHGTHIESGKKWAQIAGIPFFENENDFLNKNFDGIIITNAVDKHLETIQKIGSRVSFIVCEKPLIANGVESGVLAGLSKSGKLPTLFVVGQKKYNPQFLQFCELCEQKKGKKIIKILLRKRRDKKYFENPSFSKQLVYSQLPHALDLAWELAGGSLNLQGIKVHSHFNSITADHLVCEFAGPSCVGTIEIEAFHAWNFEDQIWVSSPDFEMQFPQEASIMSRILHRRRDKKSEALAHFTLMYRSFCNQLEARKIPGDIFDKAEFLGQAVEEIKKV